MNDIPYKHYLTLLREETSSPFAKVAISAFSLFFLAAGILGVLLYQYAQEAPLRARYQYLESASIDFSSANQSTNELLTAFNVAGEKVQIIDTLHEKQNQDSGFFLALDDLEKTLSKIESTKNNIDAKKIILESKAIPPSFLELHNQLLDFYGESQLTLNQIHSDHLFVKQLLLASGPKFYLPSLSQDELWEKKDTNEITKYYQDQKLQADTALAALARLSPPYRFKDYYDAQIAYLSLLVKLSDDVINTLSQKDDTDVEKATQIEKAYQILTDARKENEETSQKLLAEKIKPLDIKENLNRLASLEIKENSLENNIGQAQEQTPKPQEPNPIIKIIIEKIQRI